MSLSEYLDKNYLIIVKSISQAVTKNIIGVPENIKIENIDTDDLKIKRIQFDLFVSFQDPDKKNQQAVYIWTPALNLYKTKAIKERFPVFQILKSRSYKGLKKEYEYFKVDLIVLSEGDPVIIFTADQKTLSGTIINNRESIDREDLPHLLKWLLFK